MFEFSVVNFEVYTECEFGLIGNLGSDCNFFSYTFKNGIYALTGEINDGGWAFSYSLTPVKKKVFYLDCNSKFLLNKNECTLEDLQNISHYVGVVPNNYYLDYVLRKQTARKLVEKGLMKSKLKYTADEIRDLFEITDNRFSRSTVQAGIERFKISAAIGFANGKQIYCFPWLNKHFVSNYEVMFKGLLKTLKEKEFIVLFPMTEVKPLKDIIDDEVNIYEIFYKNAIGNHGDNFT